MRALVVFESMFGNTETIARAIADGLSGSGAFDDVALVEVGSASPEVGPGIGLLVVGGPTHAFGLTRASTRQDAARQAAGRPLVSATIGVREWLAALRPSGPLPPVATFDTRVRRPRVPGSAARVMQRRLRRLGFAVVASAASFYVDGTTGPLLDGERDRAQRWGARLAEHITSSHQRVR